MKRFDYARPTTVAEAIAAWAPGAAWLGGGTNLVDMMKTGAVLPDRLIDLAGLPGLDGIELSSDGSARIGALVRNSDLAHDPAFAAAYPMVAEAILAGASGQLRNAATVGGNLMQRFPLFRPGFAQAASDEGETASAADIGRYALTGQAEDRYLFRVPSLRNVALTAPYFHDGRAATLEAAVGEMAASQLRRTVPASDVRLIVKFLETLNGANPTGPTSPRGDTTR